MSVKFQDSNDQGTRVGFLLPVGEKFTTHFQMKQLLKYAAQIRVIFYDYNMWVVMVWNYNIQILRCGHV